MHKHYVYHFLCQPRRSCQDAETRTVSSCTASDRQLQLWSEDQYCFYVERQLKRSSASSNAVAPSPIVLPAPLSNCNPHPTPLDPEAISKLGDVVECSEFISVQTIRRRMDELEEQCAGADVIERKVVADFIEGMKSDLRCCFTLNREDSKMEALRETLAKLCSDGYTIGYGNIIQRPSIFSPFGTSMIDLYLYRDRSFTRYDCAAIISKEEPGEDNDADDSGGPSATHNEDGNNGTEDDDGTHVEVGDSVDNDESNSSASSDQVNIMRGGVCETKSADYSYYQLYAEMYHFSVQMAVKALMNGILVNQTILYGVSINYNKQNAKLYKMETNYGNNSIIIYGLNQLKPVPIPDALNYVATMI